MIKLVNQGNTIVEFLKQLEVTEPDSFEDEFALSKENINYPQSKGIRSVHELVAEFMDRAKELKEFEDELKKHKDKITPGQVGES